MTAREVAPEPGVFFVSYARTDRGPYFDKFVEQIEREVSQQTGWRDVAFVDTADIPAGADWRDEIADALRRCPVLLCLYSPSYFRSRHCGGEFGVFLERQAGLGGLRWEGNQIRGSRYIVPVLWRRQAQLETWNFPPPWLGAIQHSAGSLGARVQEQGLRGLIRTDPAAAEEVIEEIAETIVQLITGDGGPLPEYPERPSVAGLADVFEREPLALFAMEGTGAAAPPPVEKRLETSTAGDLVVVGLHDSAVAGSSWPWSIDLPDAERIDLLLADLAREHRVGLRVRGLDAATAGPQALTELLGAAAGRGLHVVLAAEPQSVAGRDSRVGRLLDAALSRPPWSGVIVLHADAGRSGSDWRPGWHDPARIEVVRVAGSAKELRARLDAALTRLRTHAMGPGAPVPAEPTGERPPQLAVPGARRG